MNVGEWLDPPQIECSRSRRRRRRRQPNLEYDLHLCSSLLFFSLSLLRPLI
jgi:hypothetical protein